MGPNPLKPWQLAYLTALVLVQFFITAIGVVWITRTHHDQPRIDRWEVEPVYYDRYGVSCAVLIRNGFRDGVVVQRVPVPMGCASIR